MSLNGQINKVICGDWREVVGQISDESIDLIITDPPYESLRKWDGIGTTARMGLGRKNSESYDPNKFFPTIPNGDLPELVYQLYRVLKNNCHCYIFCDYETLKLLCTYTTAPYFTQEGLFDNEKPLIWNKISMGMGYHYRCQYEFILMLDKGKNRRLNNLGIGDVLSFPRIVKGLVPTQKPLELYELFIKQSSNEGEIVLDPFCGSGTIVEATTNLKRRFITCDINPKYCGIARNRMQQKQIFFEVANVGTSMPDIV